MIENSKHEQNLWCNPDRSTAPLGAKRVRDYAMTKARHPYYS